MKKSLLAGLCAIAILGCALPAYAAGESGPAKCILGYSGHAAVIHKCTAFYYSSAFGGNSISITLDGKKYSDSTIPDGKDHLRGVSTPFEVKNTQDDPNSPQWDCATIVGSEEKICVDLNSIQDPGN